MKQILLSIVFFWATHVQAQSIPQDVKQKVDSLKVLLETKKVDTNYIVRLRTWNDLISDYDVNQSFNVLLKISNQCEKKLDKKLSKEELSFYRKSYGSALSAIGEAHLQLNEYEKALELSFQALKFQEKWGTDEEVGGTLNNIGIMYADMKDYDNALKYYNKIIRKESLVDTPPFASAYDNKGNILLERDSTQKAINCFVKSIQILERIKSDRWQERIGRTYSKIGTSYLGIDKPDSAEYFLNKGLAPSIALEDWVGTAYSYAVLGEICLGKKDFLGAIGQLEKALEYVLKGEHLRLRKSIHELLYDTYKEYGNDSKALEQYEFYITIRDSISSLHEKDLSFQLDVEYEYEKKAIADSLNTVNKNKLLAQEHNQEVSDQKTQTILAISILGVVLLITLLVWIAYRQKKSISNGLLEKNKLIEQSLKDKNLFMKEIHHRVKNNMQMVSSLLELKSHESQHKDVKEALLDSQSRIYSMSLAHQKMYQDDNFEALNISEYVKEIVNMLFTREGSNEKDHFTFSRLDIFINVDQAQAVGFIVHELVSNSIKYAWSEDSEREISISIEKKEGAIHLNCEDNGKGLPSGFDHKEADSMGMSLIRSFTERQLQGSISFFSSNGTKAILVFSPREWLEKKSLL